MAPLKNIKIKLFNNDAWKKKSLLKIQGTIMCIKVSLFKNIIVSTCKAPRMCKRQ